MTIGELKARLAEIPDSAQILEIARVVRDPIPQNAEPVPAIGPAIYVHDTDKGPTIWPASTTPGELTLSTYESGQRCHRSLGLYAGEWR